jgi:AcrR family transcriptional regulator
MVGVAIPAKLIDQLISILIEQLVRHTVPVTKTKAAVKPRLGRPPATDSAETRKRILDIARLSFAQRGYDAATNRNLGSEAGLTAGAIYHYFGSKLDLYIAVHDDVQERVYSRFNAAVDSADTFRAQVEAVLDEAHQMNEEDPTLAQFLGALRVDMRRNDELNEALHHARAPRESFITRMIEVGLVTGEIDPPDKEIVGAVILTILIGLTDAVSGDDAQHRRAVDGIKALIEGKLLRAAP